MIDTTLSMPAKSEKQASTARAAAQFKKGDLPPSGAGECVRSMAKMPMDKLRHFMHMKECLSPDGKKKMLKLLKYFKQLAKEEYTGNPGGETDIANADNLVAELVPTPDQNVIAKTFDTKGDFDSYVNQNRGIEITPKEMQAIVGYKNAKPTQQDKFFVRYESTDEFGTNDTTVIKKMKEGQKFCWTAFSKHEKAEEEGKPEEVTEQEGEEITVSDTIRITKSITFANDIEGSSIIIDFLRKLDI